LKNKKVDVFGTQCIQWMTISLICDAKSTTLSRPVLEYRLLMSLHRLECSTVCSRDLDINWSKYKAVV